MQLGAETCYSVMIDTTNDMSSDFKYTANSQMFGPLKYYKNLVFGRKQTNKQTHHELTKLPKN